MALDTRWLCRIALVLMAWLALPYSKPAHADAFQDTSASGLTAEEEIWRREHNVVQVAVYAGDHMPLEGWIGGQPQGVGVDYARLLASYAGLRLEFHPFTEWTNTQDPPKLSPDVDLLVAQGILPTTSDRFSYLRPYMTGGAMVVVRQDNQLIQRDSTLEGLRIAVERPLIGYNEQIRKYYPKAIPVYANDGADALDIVARGDADLYLGTGVARTRALLQHRPRDDLRILGQGIIPPDSIALALPKNREVLTRILRKAELHISQDDLLQLHKRWGIDKTVDSLPPPSSPLTAEQNEWLRHLPELRVAYETDRYPYSFDDKGEFSGIAADYLHLLSQHLGLRFKLVPANDWTEIKKLVDAHQVDLIAAGSVNDFAGQDMMFSQPYETFPGVIVTRVGGPPIAGPSDLARRVVAIREEQSMLSRAKAMLGASTLVPVGSNEAGLAMVASGKADAYIGTLPAIDSLIRNRYAAELHVIGPAGIDLDLALGLRPSDAALLPYINRELNGLGGAQRQAIRARWLTTDYYYGVPWAWVVTGIGAAVVLFGLGGFAYRRLRKAMNDKEHAERKLADELSFQHALLETLPYPVFVKDGQGRYLAVNQAYEQLLEISRNDILGKTLVESRHTPALSPEEQHESDLKMLESGESERSEVTLPPVPGGHQVHSYIAWRRPFVSAASRESRMLGTIVDVSDIRSAEAKARETEQRLSDITEAMPSVVFQLQVKAGSGRTFTYVGGDSKALLDLTPEEIIADEPELARRIHPDDRVRLLDHVHDAADALKPMPAIDFRLKVRGEWRWLRTEGGRAHRLPDGAAEWSGYWIDTTEAHQQAEELLAAKAQAETAVAAKGAFLAAMSHEIRTPMAGVVGLVELLSRTHVDTEQATMLGMAQDSAKLLLQILDDILDYSRIEADRVDLETAPFDLHQLVDSVAGLFSVGAADRGLSLHAIHDGLVGRVFAGDALRIRQILTNLMSNALKFTDTGHVTLRVVLLESTDSIQLIRFMVSDTGIGISPASLSRLFQPFTQAEQSTTRRFGGTGLGLSISKRLAEMMGGKLYLKSQPKKGTDAILELPMHMIEAAETSPEFTGKMASVVISDELLFEEINGALHALGIDVRRESAFEHGADLYIGETGNSGRQEMAVSDSISISPSMAASSGTSEVVRTGPVLWTAVADACRRAMHLENTDTKPIPTPSSRAHAARILIAEDHPINQALIHRQLDALGFDHVMVSDGVEALEELSTGRFDLLLADCHMPNMDGFELTRQLRRAEGCGPRLPIIALSASALPEQVQQCLDAGMDGFLAKPVTLHDLEAKILSIVDHPGRSTQRSHESDVDRQAAHLINFYREPAHLRAILIELLSICRKDFADLEGALAINDEARQRYWLHRIEGSLGVIGDIDGVEPSSADASIDDRVASIVARMSRLEVLVRRIERKMDDSDLHD